MIQKYTYGNPFETEAIVVSVPAADGTPAYGTISTEKGFSFTYDMDDNDVVYGLGEANRGINKRGYIYESNCSDQPDHSEDKISLYGAHNFIVVSGKQTFGLFVDYPGKLRFDIGYTLSAQLKITCEDADLYLYVIEGETPYDIVKQFRKIIGRSYIPPKFAFGFGQSRWGYTTADDFRKAADGYGIYGYRLHGKIQRLHCKSGEFPGFRSLCKRNERKRHPPCSDHRCRRQSRKRI